MRAKRFTTAAELVEDAMHVLNDVIYAWSPSRKEKLGLAVLLSTVAIPAFADTLVQGRAQFPGSLAQSVVVVVGGFQAEITMSLCNCRVVLVYEKKERGGKRLQLGSIRKEERCGKGKRGAEGGKNEIQSFGIGM